MALSDVTVKVNLVTSAGVEPVWFPLLLVIGSSEPALATAIPYAECTNLQQLEELIAGDTSKDTKAQKKEKLEKARSTQLYSAAKAIFQQSQHPNRFGVINTGSTGSTFEAAKPLIEPYLDKGWRQLIPVNATVTKEVFALMDWIENLEQRKLLFVSLTPATATYTETDSEKKTYAVSDYTRTVAVYGANGNAVFAVVGATAGKTPGSLNYRNVVLSGTTALALSEEELSEVHSKGLMAVVERAGDVVTSTGKSASGTRYIDTIDIEDYIVEQLVYNSQKALNVNDVVPYNNDGISILENAAISVMLDACDKGMIAKSDTNTYQYSVNYPGMDSVPEADIASRTYSLGEVAFTIQGAIDRVNITVDMTL